MVRTVVGGPAAGRVRVSMGERLGIGQTWRRRGDGLMVTVRQVHRADRVAEVQPLIADPGARVTLGFAELRRRWELVG